MTASKEKSLHIWEFPKTWIVEEIPDGESKSEEVKERAFEENKVVQKLVQDTRRPREEPIKKKTDNEFDYFEDKKEEVQVQVVDNKEAFAKIGQGFDPLGGGKITATPKSTNDDDLMGWHK